MLKFKNVVVGISGGVDSAVTALLLKKKGYNVHCVFMQNWDIADEKGFCSADQDYKDASTVCEQLDIKLTRVNFVKQYWNNVFSPFIEEYIAGYTPNPDVLCNRKVKFNCFFDYAINNLGADAIATGHYARSSFGPYLENYQPEIGVRLFRARDTWKCQTLFLCQVEQRALQRTMFPLGGYLKSEVKQIARENGLEDSAKRKESMGICFIGQRMFQNFIRDYIEDKPGDFIDIDTGKVMGRHNGIHQWTIGQRAKISGLGIPSYIAKKDVATNTIYIAQGKNHPYLHSHLMFTSEPHWIHSQPEELSNGDILHCKFKFQQVETWVDCQVCQTSKGLTIKLYDKKRAITAGQYAVLARESGEVMGSARIVYEGPTHFYLYYLENLGIKTVSHILAKYKEKTDKIGKSAVKNLILIDEKNDSGESDDDKVSARC